jgi:hypothetical protein
MISDTAQHVGKPRLRIGAVELCGADQDVHRCRSLTATVRAGEQPFTAPESDPAQSALGSSTADTAVVEVAVKAGQHLSMKSLLLAMRRNVTAGRVRRIHPLELADERPDPFLTDREPLLGGDTVDLTLNRKTSFKGRRPTARRLGTASIPSGDLPRSANTKNLRRPWLRQAAPVITRTLEGNRIIAPTPL